MPIGSVHAIYIAISAAARMTAVETISAIAGQGLEGDRYHAGTGTYSNHPGTGRGVTLIELEALEALQKEYGVVIAPNQTRRNLVTRGVYLNHLVDREFFVGNAVLCGMRLCEPCLHLERLSVAGAIRGLIHRGGLRADIVQGGAIRQGDQVRFLVTPA